MVLAVLLTCIALGTQEPPGDGETADPTAEVGPIDDELQPVDEPEPVEPATDAGEAPPAEDAARDAAEADASDADASDELVPEEDPKPPEELATIAFDPEALSFPNQRTGRISQPLQVKFTTNARSVVIARVELRGAGAGAFTPQGSCEGMTVAKDGGCAHSFVFSPKAEGEHTATLAAFDAQGRELGALQLTGMGISSRAAIEPASLDFSPPNRRTQQVTIESIGAASLTATGVRFEGDSGFTSNASSCLHRPWPTGERCSFQVSYRPQSAAAAASARLIIEHDAPEGHSDVALSWTRPPQPVLGSAPSSVNFGDVNLGQSAIAEVVISNSGDGPTAAIKAGLQRDGGPFTVAQNGCGAPLQAGASCTIAIRFTPPAEGVFENRLIVGDTELRLHFVDIDGRGVRLPLQ